MTRLGWTVAVLAALAVLLSCDPAPGRPRTDSEALAPTEVVEFRALYAANCAGCHGREGRGGAAIGLADPVYLAISDGTAISSVIAGGVPGTAMPAFAQSAGGMLTDVQIAAITGGIRSWSRPGALGVIPPSRVAKSVGDVQRGKAAFGTFCASCHGDRGEGGPKGSAITDNSFLALISDQGLRTVVIAGRPDLGAPGWREYVSGRPMSEQEVTDVVAWLASQRVQNPGQPYSVSSGATSLASSNAEQR